MGFRFNHYGFWGKIYIAFLYLWSIHSCSSLNDEVTALLEFRARIVHDPHGALANWKPNDPNPCVWLGVQCVEDKVQMLNLSGLSLAGTLAPELGKLTDLKSLVLCKNNFSGTIPKELGDLTKLELLDLRDNSLTGSIPAEIGRMLFLKHLFLLGNNVSDPQDLGNLGLLSEQLFVDNSTSHLTTEIGCMNRKFGHCVWQSSFRQWSMEESLVIPIKGTIAKYFNALALPLFKLRKAHGYEENCFDNLPNDSGIAQNVLVNFERRNLLDESSNLAAAPVSVAPTQQIISLPTTISSGSFPAVSTAHNNQNQSASPLPAPASNGNEANRRSPPADDASGTETGNGIAWKYIIIVLGVLVLIIVLVIIFCLWNKRAVKAIRPWKTGLSGQLQKAFITGVPKLNRAELEVACEDFSNIITTKDHYTVYKGTLSSGVEIAVMSTVVTSAQDWSKNMELAYRKKIDSLSRVNHKNFINLIGYCEEQEPFTRMMVFEYAPNGTVFEHLHVEGVEHLDWNARMRIIMGMAYCLQYMHHDLNPPVAHSHLDSNAVLLTDDFAAKIAEAAFSSSTEEKSSSKSSATLPPQADPETNVYHFGKVLFEIISGKLPDSEEQGKLEELACEFSNGKRSISYMIDPSLKSFKDKEVDVICEVIQECVQSNPRLRPTMKDVTLKLRETIGVSPEQAVPRLSPLWWAELEILSEEAT
ncbi:protein MALE DISCOVERER 2-like [Senna tora]|uniref:Protein MALE DISCOVERER 2-like n=1 Tax=Senna tora TaxID=362788 RepID=A0A834VYZ2_9FABA|nr:protein MALE DISCOVERER 2-like [Senna tora]